MTVGHPGAGVVLRQRIQRKRNLPTASVPGESATLHAVGFSTKTKIHGPVQRYR